MFCFSMLGPEFIFLLAFGQYVSARVSRKAFHEIGYTDWTVRHGFYADMGGFVFEPRNWKPFPVNAKQLFYLVEHGYINYPDINKSLIDDMDKYDGLSRFVTACQIIWFTLNVIARATQKLAITTLELTTIGFIFCTLGFNMCWKDKPMDITTTIRLKSNYTIEHILQEAGDNAREPYRFTPLDFVGREEWICTQMWKYNVNILRSLCLVRQRPKVRPIERLSSFNFPRLSRQAAMVTILVALTYSAIFMAAWNFEFPSTVEQLLWRICASLTLAITFLVGIIEVFLFWPGQAQEGTTVYSKEAESNLPGGFGGQIKLVVMRLACKHFNNSPDKDPALDVPMKSMLLTQPICAVYTVCRIFIVLEDIIGLRALPVTVFQNVDWTVYWPHI
ncbi:hypothetical protein HRR75_001951 [Exophiala dermatitidis]|nr:hypothetical protein HRR75_001951 [Exophiala dermatitidis]